MNTKKYLILLFVLFASVFMQLGLSTAAYLDVPSTHPTVQAAIEAAGSGDIIRVAQGDYPENISITTWKNIRIQGGWKSDFSSRADDASLTRIDGGVSGSVIHVEANAGESITLTIEGFTLQNGKSLHGGGVYVSARNSSYISLNATNNIILENRATGLGGGLYAQSAASGSVELQFTANEFRNNSAGGDGGGTYVSCKDSGSTVTSIFMKNRIETNTASVAGGGVALRSSGSGYHAIHLEYNIIKGNQTIEGDGGGLHLECDNASLVNMVGTNIHHNRISGNHAYSEGGGLKILSHHSGNATITLKHNTFDMNAAEDDGGGGIMASTRYAGSLTLNLNSNVISNNQVLDRYTEGGGIDVYSGDTGSRTTLSLTNNIIAENSAYDGAGISAGAENSGKTRLTLINDTITENTAGDDGGGVKAGSYDAGTTTVDLINEILWGNTADDDGGDLWLGEGSGGSTMVTSSHTDIGDVYNTGGTYIPDATNLDADCLLTTNCHLSEGSACIDEGRSAGAPDRDFDDQERPQGSEVDMGADEYVAGRPGCYTNYSLDNPGPFYNYDAFVRWDTVPTNGYIYPAFQFFFEVGQGGYMGTQLVGDSRKAIFSIWDTTEGSGTAQPVSSNCTRFEGEGTGAKCIMNYPWQNGREYRLRVWQAGEDGSGESWVGAIYDTITGAETVIGLIHLQNIEGYTGYGWLINWSSTFLEYFGGAQGCQAQPRAKVSWRGPYANRGSFLADCAIVPIYPSCASGNVASDGRPLVSHEAGDGVQRVTQPGLLWCFGSSLSSDLIVESVAVNPPRPMAGETVEVTVTVKNRGNSSTQGAVFRVDLYKHLTFPPEIDQSGELTWTVSEELAYGASTTLTGNLVYDVSGNHRLYVQVDTGQALFETDETNNILGPVEIPVGLCNGDFDGDDDVDGSDLAMFAGDFGRTDCSGDCEGDFDGDNDVDGSDLAVFAADFGRTDCP